MRIERERDRDFRRWSVEFDDWVMRFLVLALVAVLVPDAGVLIADVLRVLAR